jgi:hypothetical protein
MSYLIISLQSYEVGKAKLVISVPTYTENK